MVRRYYGMTDSDFFFRLVLYLDRPRLDCSAMRPMESDGDHFPLRPCISPSTRSCTSDRYHHLIRPTKMTPRRRVQGRGSDSLCYDF